jgi:adenylate cyclase
MLERFAAGETVLRVDGKEADITVMFADLSGFTKLSTEVSSDVFIEQSRQSLAYIVQEIEAKGGWVNQFLGDCVMAIWGAPLEDELHAMHAVQAAVAASRRIGEVRHAFHSTDPRALDIKIGVNSGLASIGKFGTGGRGAYTAAGISVNLAARFAQIPTRYGCRIVLGEETAKRVNIQFVLRELDRVRVKGVSEALAIFEPIGERCESSIQHTHVDQYAEALDLYRQRRFSEAAKIWESSAYLESEQASNPSKTMGERARRLAEHSFSGEWDAVWDLSGLKEG